MKITKKQKKWMWIIGIITVLLVFIALAGKSQEIITYKDTEEYGLVEIRIYKPSFLSKFLNPVFMKETVYKGEQVDLYDSITRLGGECVVEYWELFLINEEKGTEVGLGNVAEFANIISGCNLEVFAAIVTDESGTYNLASWYRWKGGSDRRTEGTNQLTVLDILPPIDCEYQDWEYFRAIENGYLKWRQYKDLDVYDDNLCTDQKSEYKTICDESSHISCEEGIRIKNGINLCVKDGISENCNGNENYDWIIYVGIILIIGGIIYYFIERR